MNEEINKALRLYYVTHGMDKPLEEMAAAGQRDVERAAAEMARKKAEGNVTPPAPPGVHVLKEQRVTDEARDGYLDQLRDAYSRGCMDEAEFTARNDAMMKAAVKKDLDFLVGDLPAKILPAARTPEERRRFRVPPVAWIHSAVLLSALLVLLLIIFFSFWMGG